MRENAQASALLDGVRDGLATAAASRSAPAVPEEMGHIQAVNEAAAAIARTPEFQHVTSTEEWWRSRANWASIISIGTPMLGWIVLKFTGVEWTGFEPRDADMLALILSTVGGVWAGYLARRARTATKPLGK